MTWNGWAVPNTPLLPVSITTTTSCNNGSIVAAETEYQNIVKVLSEIVMHLWILHSKILLYKGYRFRLLWMSQFCYLATFNVSHNILRFSCWSFAILRLVILCEVCPVVKISP